MVDCGHPLVHFNEQTSNHRLKQWDLQFKCGPFTEPCFFILPQLSVCLRQKGSQTTSWFHWKTWYRQFGQLSKVNVNTTQQNEGGKILSSLPSQVNRVLGCPFDDKSNHLLPCPLSPSVFSQTTFELGKNISLQVKNFLVEWKFELPQIFIQDQQSLSWNTMVGMSNSNCRL